MKALVAQAMQDGAFGISTALIYPPGHYAKTEELIELAKVASQYGGIYGSHMRSEGQSEVAAIEEALRIGREANLPVEIFHLKVIGKPRWGLDAENRGENPGGARCGPGCFRQYVSVRCRGTALASSLPPWVAEGGTEKLLERLQGSSHSGRNKQEMATEHPEWENLYLGSGGAGGVLISGSRIPTSKNTTARPSPRLQPLRRRRPSMRSSTWSSPTKLRPEQSTSSLTKTTLRYGLKQPWTSLGLDASETFAGRSLVRAPLSSSRFRNMPRFLGHYVRDEHLLPLEQAIRKMTSLPAQRERLRERGLLKEGYFADVTIFDPATIKEKRPTKSTELSRGRQICLRQRSTRIRRWSPDRGEGCADAPRARMEEGRISWGT